MESKIRSNRKAEDLLYTDQLNDWLTQLQLDFSEVFNLENDFAKLVRYLNEFDLDIFGLINVTSEVFSKIVVYMRYSNKYT